MFIKVTHNMFGNLYNTLVRIDDIISVREYKVNDTEKRLRILLTGNEEISDITDSFDDVWAKIEYSQPR